MSTSKKNALLPDDQLDEVAELFRVLGEPMRLRILQSICRRARPVNEIVEALGASQANVSKHLAILAGAGIVEREKKGQQVYYEMKNPLAIKLCALVHEHWT